MSMRAETNQVVRRQQIKTKILEYDSWKLFELIKYDIARNHGWKSAFQLPGFWVITGYRIGRSLYKNRLDWLAKCIQVLIVLLTGCSFSRKAILGPGVRLYHPKDIFIGPYVWIGEKSTLGPHIFIGSNLEPDNPEDYPIIDDGVLIAFGAVILGGVALGKEVQIGPNAVVVKDVPDNYNVMPSPSRAIPRDGWKKCKAP